MSAVDQSLAYTLGHVSKHSGMGDKEAPICLAYIASRAVPGVGTFR